MSDQIGKAQAKADARKLKKRIKQLDELVGGLSKMYLDTPFKSRVRLTLQDIEQANRVSQCEPV